MPQSYIAVSVAPGSLQQSSEHDRKEPCWTTAHLLSSTPRYGLMLFKSLILMQVSIPLHKCNLSRFMVLLSDIVIGQLGDQWAFALMFLFLCICNNPPSHIFVLFHCSLRWSRRFGHSSPLVCSTLCSVL